jgi:general secretion pathway protein C
MNSARPRHQHLQKLAIIALLLLLGYAGADLAILSIRDKFLPGAPPNVQPSMRQTQMFTPKEKFQIITGRNIFSADQKIPDAIGGTPQLRDNADPVLTSLPLALVGTLVHANPTRSVATVNLKNKNEVIAIRVDGEIPEGLGTVTKIERSKMVFRNSSNGRLEYVELKEEGTLSFNVTSTAVAPGIMMTSDTDRTVKRGDLDKYLKDLPAILQQARAVPRIGANGNIECFNIADLQAGSVLEALGIRRGDCIETVNGERIDSPQKAMETFQKLRAGTDQINLGFERGGRKENSNFTIIE